MVLTIKNKKLHRETYKKLDKLHDKALKNYNLGKVKEGLKFEKLADKLYSKNYKKIWKIKK